MNGSILLNGSQRSELVILVKGKRYRPVMASAPANKENVSPEKDMECLSDSFQKSLTMNHVEKDGRYFLDVMEKESERLTRLCQIAEQEMESKSLPEDGKIFWDYCWESVQCIRWKVRFWFSEVYQRLVSPLLRNHFCRKYLLEAILMKFQIG